MVRRCSDVDFLVIPRLFIARLNTVGQDVLRAMRGHSREDTKAIKGISSLANQVDRRCSFSDLLRAAIGR